MSFEIEKSYAWDAICEALTINERWRTRFLYERKKVVICGFLNLWQNPKPCQEILVGNKEYHIRAANKFIEQNNCIPIFLKLRKQDQEWQFLGYFRPKGQPITDPVLLRDQKKQNALKYELSMILNLEQVDKAN